MKAERVTYYSEPIQEIMGTIPSWITRWGVTVLFSILIIILLGCCVIKYPETVKGAFELVSSEADGCYGTVFIPSSGIGKVKAGQIVNARLSGFPYMEYGIIKGIVKEGTPAFEKRQDGSVVYKIDILFPPKLQTTYEKDIPFISGMNGSAEVVTEEKRLIEAVMGPIKSVIWNR